MPELTIAPLAPASLHQVAGWPDTFTALTARLRAALGVDALPAVGRFLAAGGADIAALAPGRFLLVNAALPALPAEEAAVTDLSHARTAVRLSGPAARPLLERGISLDLDPAALPPGAAVQTLCAHFDVTLLRRDLMVFDLYVPASYGEAFRAWLDDARLGV